MIHALIPSLQFNGRGAIATIAVPDSVGEEAALEGDCSGGGGGGVCICRIFSFFLWGEHCFILLFWLCCAVLCCGDVLVVVVGDGMEVIYCRYGNYAGMEVTAESLSSIINIVDKCVII